MQHLNGKTTFIASSDNERRNYSDTTGLGQRITFKNYTGKKIYIINRFGLINEIHSVSARYLDCFIIRLEYLVPYGNYESLKKSFYRNIDFLNKFKEIFYINLEHNNVSEMVVALDITIEQDKISEYNTVYINDLDIVLTTEDPTTVMHPYSDEAIENERYKDLNSLKGEVFSIEIIDNYSILSERYCCIGESVFKIVPSKDITKEDGIYLTTKIDGKLESIKFDLNKPEQAGLYRTQEEALNYGNIKLNREQEIAKLSHENSLISLEMQKIKHENAKKIAELDLNIKELEKEMQFKEKEFEKEKMYLEKEIRDSKAAYETKKIIMEDFYNERSHNRKDSSEIIKFIPAAIAAGLAIWVAVLKSKQ